MRAGGPELQNTGVIRNAALSRLEESLDDIRQAPADGGTLELIVSRPAEDERVVMSEAWLDTTDGLQGDNWKARGSSRTPDGSANPDAQLTLISARVAAAVAGPRERWPLAGDQLFVDLDLSLLNLPPGSRVEIGSAVIEFSAAPHTGCAKFSARYGNEAQVFVNSAVGRELRLRGANCRVVTAGVVRQGDTIRKVSN
jgi:hypothetical protein